MLKRHGALLIILLLAAALRIYHIGTPGLWTDELASVEASAGLGLTHNYIELNKVIEPAPDMMSLGGADRWLTLAPNLVRDDNHPPLYFFLLRLWRTLFGDTEAAMRSLSALAGLAAVVLIYDAVNVAHAKTPALWAALLTALAGPQIQFSQEVRAYMLMTALGCGVLSALVRIENFGVNARRVIALGACALAMMFSHYYAIGPLGGIFLYAIFRLRGKRRKFVLGAFVASALVMAPLWGRQMIEQQRHLTSTTTWMLELPEGFGSRMAQRLAILPMRFLNEPMKTTRALATIGVVIYLLPLLLARRHPKLLLWWCWMCGAIGLVAAIDWLRTSSQLDFMRYTVVATPAGFAIIAALAADAKSRLLRNLLPAAAAISCAISVPRAYVYFSPPKPEWRHLVAALQSAGNSGNDLLVIDLTAVHDVHFSLSVYMGLNLYLWPPPRAVLLLGPGATDEEIANVDQFDSLILVTPGGAGVMAGRAGWEGGRMPRDEMLPMISRWVRTTAPARP